MVVLDLIEIILDILSILNAMNLKEIFQYFRSPDSFPFEKLLPHILVLFVLLGVIKLQWKYVVVQGLPPKSDGELNRFFS